MGPEYIKRHGLTFHGRHLLPVALYNVTGLSSGDDIKNAMYAFPAWIDGDRHRHIAHFKLVDCFHSQIGKRDDACR